MESGCWSPSTIWLPNLTGSRSSSINRGTGYLSSIGIARRPGSGVRRRPHWNQSGDEPIDHPPTCEMAEYIEMSMYLVLGDNRANSNDSHLIGPIEQSQVVGHARLVIFPSTASAPRSFRGAPPAGSIPPVFSASSQLPFARPASAARPRRDERGPEWERTAWFGSAKPRSTGLGLLCAAKERSRAAFGAMRQFYEASETREPFRK